MHRPRATLAAALATAALALGACDPGNAETTIGERTLKPQSAAWGIAHYHEDNLFIDDDYDVTWIVVSDRPDVCGHFTKYMACDPETNRNPEGLHLSLDFNSFADTYSSIEEVTGGIHLTFKEVADGELAWKAEATKGYLNGRGHAGDRLFGSYRVTLDTGEEVEGSWSADKCEALSDLLKEDFAEREHCTH